VSLYAMPTSASPQSDMSEYGFKFFYLTKTNSNAELFHPHCPEHVLPPSFPSLAGALRGCYLREVPCVDACFSCKKPLPRDSEKGDLQHESDLHVIMPHETKAACSP
jgi:hypothetical protein